MRVRILAGVIAVATIAVVAPVASGQEAAPQPIFDGGASSYPRVIKLEHSGDANGRIIGSVTSVVDGSQVGIIVESTDNAQSFHPLATIKDPEGADGRGMCCGTLYELPIQVGAMPAGTLLYAATAGYKLPDAQRHTKQRLWESRDHGRTWTFKSDIDTSPNKYNAWEPDLSVSMDGYLVANWSDESDKPAHDQKMVQARSADGITWTDKRDLVVHPTFEVRPGMPGVRRLKDGTYFMVYEVCNLDEPLCSAYYRTSANGWDYGDPNDLGTVIRTADGKYARHTPSISVGPTGQLVFASEMLVNADGSHAPGNGTTLLVNDNDGAGPWREIPAPVPVPDPNNEGCRNFSPSLIAGADSVFEVATDNIDGVCTALFATGPIPPAG
jgi:hypothetical protein